MPPYGNTPSLFLVGTDNERLFSHLHHPFEKERFSLMEEATTQMTPACATSPDKSRITWMVDAPTKLCVRQQPYVFALLIESAFSLSDCHPILQLLTFSIYSAHHSYQHGYMFLLYFDTDHA